MKEIPCRTCPTLPICASKVKKEREHYSKEYLNKHYPSMKFRELDIEFVCIEGAIAECPMIQEYTKNDKSKISDCLKPYYFGELKLSPFYEKMYAEKRLYDENERRTTL